ncbi:hypothetical protein C7R54_14720 [Achromobacter aloeverae]|uniref:Uncharacterized protein n=1 Tax=Achromobacter aloeverae TaxID=1750518 RepID=A0A4Q1HHZ4_9BURK|nr:hypothetical protein C7R54_14720 [Achromobacter aloeverae]
MMSFRSASRLVLLAIVCASFSACADTPSGRAGPAAPGEPDYVTRPVPNPSASSDQRLTIRAGEAEKLRLPWFIQDAKDWVNTR